IPRVPDAPAGGVGCGSGEGRDPKGVLGATCFFEQLDVDLNNLAPMTFAEPHTRGGGRDVVVVIIEVVAIDVGSGELDCIVMRSITRVVIGGTEEVS
ncbi:hypothetical protein Tco_1234033, partial [Tanacetum coccineum]